MRTARSWSSQRAHGDLRAVEERQNGTARERESGTRADRAEVIEAACEPKSCNTDQTALEREATTVERQRFVASSARAAAAAAA